MELILGLTPKEEALLMGIRKRKSELLIEIQVIQEMNILDLSN